MGRAIVLKFEGDLTTQGFRITLEIRSAINQIEIETQAQLPPNPILVNAFQAWQEKYRYVGAPARIKPKRIVYDGNIQQRRDECKQASATLRDHFLSWLRSESFRPIELQLREELDPNEEIRLLLRSADQILQKLPWHEWDFVQRYSRTEVVLTSSQQKYRKVFRANSSPKNQVLAILGHSDGINIETDRTFLKSLPNSDVTFLVEPQRQQLGDSLWERSWDVIFFAGHSETEGETGRIYLNPTDSLTIDELWLHLKQAVNRGLKLAIFNSCDGLGLVRRLDDLEIPHLIVMRELVPDRVAQEFLKYLLTALSQDKPVHLAVREARERLEILEHEFPCATWLPVIHQNIEYIPVSSPAPPPASIPLKQICLISLAVTTLVMGIRWTGFLQSAELQAYDHLMRSRPAEEPDPRLLLVSIDEEDIRQYTYPIPADTLATALEKLQRKKPIAIGVNIYQDSPVGTGKDRLLNLLKNNQQFISACKFESDDNQNLEVTNPPPGIADGQVGFVNIMRDWQQGYSIRRQILSRSDNPVSSFSQCNTPYSLTLLLAIEYLEFNQLIAQSNIHQDWELGEIVFRRLNSYSGGYQNLDARGNQILVNYRNTKQIAQSVSLRDILNEKYHPDWIENKIVLVGVTASSVDFGENTPIGMLPKLYVQAQMLSSIISTVEKERLLIRWLPVWADALWVGSWSLLGVGLVIYRRSRHPWFWATVGTVTAILYGCCWVAFTVGIWLPLIPAAIGLLVPIAIYSVTRPTKSSISQIPP